MEIIAIDPLPEEVKTERVWTPVLACMCVETDCEATEEEQLEAWAYLIKTGLCWQLQGWYGRAAASLIEGGRISKTGEILSH